MHLLVLHIEFTRVRHAAIDTSRIGSCLYLLLTERASRSLSLSRHGEGTLLTSHEATHLGDLFLVFDVRLPVTIERFLLQHCLLVE